MSGAVSFALPVTPPFDFRLSLAFLDGFTPAQGEQGTGGELRKATRLDGQTVGFVVRPERGGLLVSLYPERTLNDGQVQALRERIAFFLGVDDDLKPFYTRAEQDEAFRPVLRELRGFHQPRFLTPYEAACWAVITQRRPLAQARLIKRALSERWGGRWEGRPAFPEPRDLAGVTGADLMTVLPDERKARALLEITAAFQGVSTADLVARPYDEVRDWLLGLYGVGGWSALFVLLRGLGRVERLNLDGPLLKELLGAARPVYGDLTPQQLRETAERHGEQRGQWAIYLRSRPALVAEKESAA